jgi:hypothetical protein
MRNIVLTGVPRGGTTLACRLLGDCMDSIALFEPMDVRTLPKHDPAAAAREVARFFASTRQQLRERGSAPSKLQDGRLPDNPFAEPDPGTGLRRLQAREGVLQTAVPDGAFTLVIKHNAAFTALLPSLPDAFERIAIVRNPLAVLASWHSLDLPVSAGRLPAGERLDPDLARALQREPDLLSRQLRILDWFFARYAGLPAARVLRYEDIVAGHGQPLFDCARLAPRAPADPLHDRNATPACALQLPPRLARRLLAQPGAWRAWYPEAAISGLLQRMMERP